MLTRKHFNEIAAILQSAHGIADGEDTRQFLIRRFRDMCEESNENFDNVRFLRACGAPVTNEDLT